MAERVPPVEVRRDITGTFAELALITVEAASPEQALRRVVGLARQVLPGVEHLSLTLVKRGRPRTGGSTGRLAADLDEGQYELGSGPCLDAARASRTIVVDHDDDSSPYEEFARAVGRVGVRHTVSVGVPLGQQSISLNIYSTVDAAFAAEFLEQVTEFTRYAAVAVDNVSSHVRAVEHVSQLRAARETRGVIERAKGILMARARCNPDEAFAVLKRLSQHGNTKLTEVAQSVVDGVES